MLTKSSAKWFFIIGTSLFSLIFLGLTVDTVRQAPKRTNAQNLTKEVARGKLLWDENNCMGCHTLLGEGAYYAPELTKVYERRGPVWMKAFIRDPEAMFPGRRKMIKYGFNETELDDLVAFFKWIGEMDLNGFPKKTRMAALVGGANMDGAGPAGDIPKIYTDLCVACHQLGGVGGTVGPALDGVSQRMDSAAMKIWLNDPQAVKPGTLMPKLGLSPAHIDELTLFLSQQ